MTYDRRQVEALIPAIWDDAYLIHGVEREEVRDPEMPKGPGGDPSHQGGHVVAIVDVRRAWKWSGLTLREKEAIALHYGMSMTWREVGRVLNRDHTTVREGGERGVGRMVAWLNGKDMEEAA